MVKALKFFRIYVLHSKVIAYVPNAAIKDVLTQPNNEGKRGKWIAKIMEYDVDIRPTKLVKGQGLAKLLAESNCQYLGLHLMAKDPAQIKQSWRKRRLWISIQHLHGMQTLYIICCTCNV